MDRNSDGVIGWEEFELFMTTVRLEEAAALSTKDPCTISMEILCTQARAQVTCGRT